MSTTTVKKVLATIVAAGTFGFAASGAASAADAGGAGGVKPGAEAGQDAAGHPRLRIHVLRGGIRVAATAIGVPVRELVEGLRDGKTVEQFATSKGVDPTTVKAALVKAANDAIDAAVARGVITDERAAKLKEHVSERVDKFMTRSWPRLTGQGAPQAS